MWRALAIAFALMLPVVRMECFHRCLDCSRGLCLLCLRCSGSVAPTSKFCFFTAPLDRHAAINHLGALRVRFIIELSLQIPEVMALAHTRARWHFYCCVPRNPP